MIALEIGLVYGGVMRVCVNEDKTAVVVVAASYQESCSFEGLFGRAVCLMTGLPALPHYPHMQNTRKTAGNLLTNFRRPIL